MTRHARHHSLKMCIRDPTTQGVLHPLILVDLILDGLCVVDFASNFIFGYISLNSSTTKAELITD